jgi:DNA-binding GntR family transcriptional regulator
LSAGALTTVDALTESLRARLLDGDLKPGTPPREEALSREKPNRGARVKSLSPEDVRASEHLALVEALESEGAEVLRPHIEESTRALLEA